MNEDRTTLRKYWERTGCLLTADGTCDDRVHLHSGVELGPLPTVVSPVVVDVVDEEDGDSAERGGIGLGGGVREGKGEAKGGGGNAKSKVKREDIDNVKHDDDELDLAEEDDPDEDLRPTSLRDALPVGWHVIDAPPAVFDKSLVGSLMALRWNVTGWEWQNCSILHAPQGPRGPQLRSQVSSRRPGSAHRLRALEYSGSDDAPAGSWCMLRWQPPAQEP